MQSRMSYSSTGYEQVHSRPPTNVGHDLDCTIAAAKTPAQQTSYKSLRHLTSVGLACMYQAQHELKHYDKIPDELWVYARV